MANKSHPTTPVQIGTAEHSVTVGGENPIVVQSMTNTDTADVPSTVKQVMELAKAGSELVRITVNVHEAAEAVPEFHTPRTKTAATLMEELEEI